MATEWVPLKRSRMRIGWDCERKGRGRASRSAREGRAAAGAMGVEVSVKVSVGYVRWAGVWARVWEGALREGPSGMGGWGIGEGVGWADGR